MEFEEIPTDMISMTFAADICDADDPCSMNTA